MPRPDDPGLTGWLGAGGAWWGVAGVLALLVYAVARLTPIALETFDHPLAWHHWLGLAANLVFMAYSEGYRGFQRSFSPRVAERAALLRAEPTALRVLLAPAWCIGYFDSPRRIQVTAVVLTLAIVVLVLIVHRIDQPWRGIIDAGVVLGLLWGILATAAHCLRRLRPRAG